MGSILGGPAGQKSKEKLPEWARGAANWLFSGREPGGPLNPNADVPQSGPFADALAGWQAATPQQLFGGLSNQIPWAQNAGQILQGQAQGGGLQGWLNALGYGNQANSATQQTQQIAGMIPGGMDAANYYLQHVTGATQGNNVQGGSGAGQQVVNAALGASTSFGPDMYKRVVAEGLPEVRASYSARGLGTGGEAARGEQEYIQRTRDMLAQQEVQNRIAALGTAASAAGPAASQAIGAQQAAIGRGQLGLQAAQAPGQIMGQFQNVASSPLDALTSALGLQMGPGQVAGQQGQLSSMALNLPLEYQQGIYNLTRDGGKSLLTALAGQKQSSSTPDYRGIFGIPKS